MIVQFGYNAVEVLGNTVFISQICFGYNTIKHIATGYIQGPLEMQ
jgi:hypothetical protein